MASRPSSSFVASEKVIEVISVAKVYECRPSELLDIEDAYTAYCLDEACALIVTKMQQGETPHFKKEYKSFRDIYKQYNV